MQKQKSPRGRKSLKAWNSHNSRVVLWTIQFRLFVNIYSACFRILNNLAKQFDKVLLRDDDSSYEIPVKIILEEGKFLFFKSQGFEVQIFLPLERIKDFERGHII